MKNQITTKARSRTARSNQTSRNNKPGSATLGRGRVSDKVQRDALARSRGDSPSADKPSERSPRQENL